MSDNYSLPALHRVYRYDLGAHMRIRMAFKDMKPMDKLAWKGEKSFAQASLLVGHPGTGVEDGIAVLWSLSKVAKPEEFLAQLKLPRESGTAIILEFMLKEKVSQKEAKKIGEAAVMYLRYHFEDELKKNIQFRGIFALAGESEGDGGEAGLVQCILLF